MGKSSVFHYSQRILIDVAHLLILCKTSIAIWLKEKGAMSSPRLQATAGSLSPNIFQVNRWNCAILNLFLRHCDHDFPETFSTAFRLRASGLAHNCSYQKALHYSCVRSLFPLSSSHFPGFSCVRPTQLFAQFFMVGGPASRAHSQVRWSRFCRREGLRRYIL